MESSLGKLVSCCVFLFFGDTKKVDFFGENELRLATISALGKCWLREVKIYKSDAFTKCAKYISVKVHKRRGS